MKWKKISAYCIAHESYLIARITMGGVDWFELHAGQDRLGMWKSADEARQAASKHKGAA